MTPEQTSNSADATEPARYVIDEASVLGRNRRILLATLAQAGAVTATATYVGCGDSGGDRLTLAGRGSEILKAWNPATSPTPQLPWLSVSHHSGSHFSHLD